MVWIIRSILLTIVGTPRITLDRLATTGRPWSSEAWAGDAVGVGDLEFVGILAAAFEEETSPEALAAGVSAGITCGGVVVGGKQPRQTDSQGRGGALLFVGIQRGAKEVDMAAEYTQT